MLTLQLVALMRIQVRKTSTDLYARDTTTQKYGLRSDVELRRPAVGKVSGGLEPAVRRDLLSCFFVFCFFY